MTLHHLNGRLAKLEAQSTPPDPDALTKGRTLIVWRRPEETEQRPARGGELSHGLGAGGLPPVSPERPLRRASGAAGAGVYPRA